MVSFDANSTRGPWVIFGPSDAKEFREQLDALQAAGGQVHHFQARDLLTERELFRVFAEKLEFPGYFGQNWDALVDCLDDLCAAVTGGVGMAGVIHDADMLATAEHLRLFVSVLCQAADRANSDVDLDGDPLDRPAIAEHFIFLLDEADVTDLTARIEHTDLVVTEEGQFLTVALNPDAW
ncbi:barstar family protein [Streptomyces sp. NPDC050738]|uniref:barstar family protein n=1 Tax=Streptomyces sp. NPDC050738 TaxID=3154744 RepID=UPI00343B7A78